MELLPVVRGLASCVPGWYSWNLRRRTLRTANPAYCYSWWIRHISLLELSGHRPVLQTVAELGPGGSLGVGLASLLSGANTYYARDIVRYSEVELSLRMLDGLIELFRKRTPVVLSYAEPNERPVFPSNLLTSDVLERSLNAERIADIRRALTAADGRSGPITIQYTVPWSDPAVVRKGEVDLIISTSVLEHVDDLAGTYGAFAQWLRPDGLMSHSVDFRSHFNTSAWNSHWEYPEAVWKLVVGRKPFLINRQPCSPHVAQMKANGFEVTRESRKRERGLPASKLARRWRGMDGDDITCIESTLQGRLMLSSGGVGTVPNPRVS